jgi:chemotaxis signal transduction protein
VCPSYNNFILNKQLKLHIVSDIQIVCNIRVRVRDLVIILNICARIAGMAIESVSDVITPTREHVDKLLSPEDMDLIEKMAA